MPAASYRISMYVIRMHFLDSHRQHAQLFSAHSHTHTHPQHARIRIKCDAKLIKFSLVCLFSHGALVHMLQPHIYCVQAKSQQKKKTFSTSFLVCFYCCCWLLLLILLLGEYRWLWWPKLFSAYTTHEPTIAHIIILRNVSPVSFMRLLWSEEWVAITIGGGNSTPNHYARS